MRRREGDGAAGADRLPSLSGEAAARSTRVRAGGYGGMGTGDVFGHEERRRRPALRRLRRLARGLGVRDPLDLALVRLRVQQRRRRPLRLVPVDCAVDEPCGLWLDTGVEDVVCYPRHTSPLHQLCVVLHEIGHIVLGHRGQAAAPVACHVRDTPGRGHGFFGDPQERDAELFATVGLALSGLGRPSVAGYRHAATAAARLDRGRWDWPEVPDR